MEAGLVIVLFDEDRHVPTQVPEIPIPVRVNLLPLQCLHETFATGIVVRLCWPTHTRDHLVLLEDLHVLA